MYNIHMMSFSVATSPELEGHPGSFFLSCFIRSWTYTIDWGLLYLYHHHHYHQLHTYLRLLTASGCWIERSERTPETVFRTLTSAHLSHSSQEPGTEIGREPWPFDANDPKHPTWKSLSHPT